MRTSKRVIVLLSVALTGIPAMSVMAGQDQSAAPSQPSQRKSSNTRFASCIVRITVDPTFMPLNMRTIEGLFYSSAVVSKAGHKVLSLDMPEDAQRQLIRTELLDMSSVPMSPATPASRQEQDLQGDEEMMRQFERIYNPYGGGAAGSTNGERKEARRGTEGTGRMMGGRSTTGSFGASNAVQQGAGMEQIAMVKLSVSLPDTVPLRAAEFLREVVANLEDSLFRACEMQKIELNSFLDFARKQQEKARTAVEDGAESTPAAGPGQPQEPARRLRVEVDVRVLAAQCTELARKGQDLELELASMDARRKAIEMQIDEAQSKAAKKLDEDPVTQELQQLVRMSDESLALLQKQVETGRASESELSRARESLTRAKIELAKRREELAKSAGGDQISGFNNELSRMAIDGAAIMARLGLLRVQHEEMQAQLSQASKFDPEAARIRMAQEALDIASRRVGELQRRIANLQPPMVTMIGAN